MHNIDYKFILIPVMFIFLRIWSLIINILLDYCRVQVPETALKALLYMAVSLLLVLLLFHTNTHTHTHTHTIVLWTDPKHIRHNSN